MATVATTRARDGGSAAILSAKRGESTFMFSLATFPLAAMTRMAMLKMTYTGGHPGRQSHPRIGTEIICGRFPIGSKSILMMGNHAAAVQLLQKWKLSSEQTRHQQRMPDLG